MMSWWAQRGPRAWLLRPLSGFYRLLTGLDRWRYRAGLARIERLPVPVLVVGNWITGGAGKTPTLLAILALLQQWGLRAGVVSRGYGRQSQGLVVAPAPSEELGDEPLLIHRRSGAPLAVSEQRAEAGRALLAEHPNLQLLICDDGLQHHALARDLSIWVFDRRGLGNGWLLPAGPLRQDREHAPLPGSRAEHLVLYSDGQRSTDLPGFLGERRLLQALPLSDWWAGEKSGRALPSLSGERWLACAGLAQPQAFFEALQAHGLVLQTLPLPDHASFEALPWPPGASVLVTEKDAVKLQPDRPGCENVWVVPLDLALDPAFAAALKSELKALLPLWTPD